MHRIKLHIGLAIVIGALAGCGGGASNSGPVDPKPAPPPPPDLQKQFMKPDKMPDYRGGMGGAPAGAVPDALRA